MSNTISETNPIPENNTLPAELSLSLAEGDLEYSLTNDYMFHAVFQECPEALKGLLAALLDRKEEDILTCDVLNPIILGEHVNDKSNIMDIRILLNGEGYVNLEMQVAGTDAWPERSLYYLCRLFTNLEAGENYDEVMPAVHIGILNFSPFPEDKSFYAKYRMINKKTGQVYSDKFALNVLDLTQIGEAEEEEKRTEVYKWANLFKAKRWEEICMLANTSKSINKAGETMKKLIADQQIKLQCEAREKYERDKIMYEKGRKKLQEEMEELKAGKEQLKAGEEQLKAGEEQLKAGEEQLKASEYQLKAEKEQLAKERDELIKLKLELEEIIRKSK